MIAIQLPEVYWIEGRVVLAGGQQVPDVVLAACPLRPDFCSDGKISADGSFRVPVFVGKYRLRVRVGNSAFATYDSHVQGGLSERSYTTIQIDDSNWTGIRVVLP